MTRHSLAPIIFALLAAFTSYARAETGDSPPPPDRNPVRLQAPAAEAPVLPGDAPTVAWTDAEVATAKLDCARALAGLELEYEALPPIKEGMCGAPAPILLKSIGSNPKVAIEPPATVTCAVARGLAAWLNNTVQPNAEALLDAQVVKLHNATSYACRNRYGGETTPLSEHALANALDVSEFVFQSGERVTVLESWPSLATASSGSVDQATSAAAKGEGAIEVTKAKLSDADAKANPFVLPPRSKTNPFVRPAAAAESSPPMNPPSATPPQAESRSLSDRKSKFVKIVHDDACNIFGTVLGPEANEAHKNHFHLDMKARKRRAFCE